MPDLAGVFSSGAQVFEGSGDGSFTAAGPAISIPTPNRIAVGDVNEDGKLDFALSFTDGLSFTTGVRVYLGDGAFGFAAQPAIAGLAGGDVALAEMNGDGHLDVVSAGAFAPGVGDGTFGAPPSAPSGTRIATGDFDGDGFTDLLMSTYTGYGYNINLWLNNGTGVFAPAMFSPQASTFCSQTDVIAKDFNGDGRLDFYVNEQCGGAGGGSFYSNVAGPIFVMNSVTGIDATTVEVVFSQTPNQAQAEDPTNYSINAVTTSFAVTAAVLNGNTVTLTTESQSGGMPPYTLYVTGVTRASDGASLLSDHATFNPGVGPVTKR